MVSTGTADSPIIVQATALKNASYFSITKNDEDYFMIGDDDLDKRLKIIHQLYLMMRCVLSSVGLKSLTVLLTTTLLGNSWWFYGNEFFKKTLLCLMKVVLQVRVDGMVQNISTHLVKALKILVQQLKYMLIKVKRCNTCDTVYI